MNVKTAAAAAPEGKKNNAPENELLLNWASINAIRMRRNYSKYIPELLVNGR